MWAFKSRDFTLLLLKMRQGFSVTGAQGHGSLFLHPHLPSFPQPLQLMLLSLLSRPFFSCSYTLEWMLVSSAPPTPTFPHLPPPARSGFSSATSSSRKPRQLGQIPVLGSESPRAFPQRTENFILPFSPTPCSLWDLSSSTRDRTFTFSSESVAF